MSDEKIKDLEEFIKQGFFNQTASINSIEDNLAELTNEHNSLAAAVFKRLDKIEGQLFPKAVTNTHEFRTYPVIKLVSVNAGDLKTLKECVYCLNELSIVREKTPATIQVMNEILHKYEA